jgi:ABC-type multidrug transport system ATPase subunit
MTAIEVEDLVKTHGGIDVVDGISFSGGAGEIFGIVGPYGAGKTTTVESLQVGRQTGRPPCLHIGQRLSQAATSIWKDMSGRWRQWR